MGNSRTTFIVGVLLPVARLLLATPDATVPENRLPFNRKFYGCANNTCVISGFRNGSDDGYRIDESLDVCRLTCGHFGSLWPRPTVATTIKNSVIRFGLDNVKLNASSVADELGKEYMTDAFRVFTSSLEKLCEPGCVPIANDLTVFVATTAPFTNLKWRTDESYRLTVSTDPDDRRITANVTAATVYGARNGLETLRQLITAYGPAAERSSGKTLVVAEQATIVDRPVYTHRGFMLDTARNYFPVSSIERTIDAMGHSKLNVFHWHATDSHSFPLDLPSAPRMATYGAYGADKVYTYDDVKRLLRYALVRGVRIVMEIDGPAHAGYGWQWGREAGYGDMVVCLGKRPWWDYCVQPPCGQLNPLNDNTYAWLGKVYGDLAAAFPVAETFHMGGDEVAVQCWNTTDEIVDWMRSNNRSLTDSAYADLWAEYHGKALRAYDQAAGHADTDVIVWSSGLTDPRTVERRLDKTRYTVQVWSGDGGAIVDLVNLGYKVIASAENVYYLDHGLRPPTVYHSWKVIYDSPLPAVGDNSDRVLGAETCMFTEFVDDFGLDTKVWPRAAALAERLWANPSTNALAAEYRLLQHRERLVALGLKPDRIAPEWCNDREGECVISY